MHQLLAYGHVRLLVIGERVRDASADRFGGPRAERFRRAFGERFGSPAERGQGTVEYVGLVLLVSLLMVGMVASMKGFTGKQGTELAEVIINKIKQAVNAIKFS